MRSVAGEVEQRELEWNRIAWHEERAHVDREVETNLPAEAAHGLQILSRGHGAAGVQRPQARDFGIASEQARCGRRDYVMNFRIREEVPQSGYCGLKDYGVSQVDIRQDQDPARVPHPFHRAFAPSRSPARSKATGNPMM